MSDMTDTVKTGFANVGESFNAAKASVTNSVNEFSKQASAGVGASTQYLQSNTIVAKIAFIILILIAFLLLFNLGLAFISYLVLPPQNPYLVNGMIDGGYAMSILQDPAQTTSIPIQRSNNKYTGAEFSWSFWIYINDLGTTAGQYQHIFSKGDANFNAATNLASVNNAPGVYLGPENNNLHIIMNTVVGTDTNTVIDISNIPIKKWVNVVIRLENTILDVYVNGVITSRLLLSNAPKQNYETVYICQNGGFSGNLSSLRYYSHAMNVFEINGIVKKGPNLTLISKSKSAASGNYTYLSSSWYSSNL